MTRSIINIVVASVFSVIMAVLLYCNVLKFNAFAVVELIYVSVMVWCARDFILPRTKIEKTEAGEVIVPVRYTFFSMSKTLLLCVMMGSIVLLYTVGRGLKDALAFGTDAGPSAVAVAKILVVAFSSLGQIIYAHLTRTVSYRRLLYWLTGGFLLIFTIFSLFCINRTGSGALLNEAIIPSIEILTKIFGWLPLTIFKIIQAVARNWPVFVFYISAEMFGSILLTSFFWQLNNQYTDKKNTGNNRMVLVVAQIASLAAGYTSDYISKMLKRSAVASLQVFNITAILCSTAMIIANYFLFKVIYAEAAAGEGVINEVKSKSTNTNIDLWSIIKNNFILVLFASTTVMYGFTLVSQEQFWKYSISEDTRLKIINNDKYSHIHQISDSKKRADAITKEASSEVGQYLAGYIRTQSRFSLVFSIFAPYLFSKIMAWTGFALTTPILVLGATTIMFGYPIVTRLMGLPIHWGSIAALGIPVITILKSAKYMFADATREKFAQYQSKENAREFKNLEGLISRYGKAAGSFVILALGAININLCDFSFWSIMLVSGVAISSLWINSVIRVSETMHDVQM